MNIERDVVKNRAPVIRLGDGANFESAKRRPRIVGGSGKSRGFVHLD
jgi:hypothetical protein